MSEQYDLLVTDLKVVDGTGKPAFMANIGIRGEKIAAVGNARGEAIRRIDGKGLVACPGFIDIHSHADLNILQYPQAQNFVMQGITTFVGGNCGLSMAPIKDYWPWGIFTPGFVGSWWHDIEPNTYGPPYFLPLEKYRAVLEEKLGYTIDWRTFGEYLSTVEETGISINYVPLVGHIAVRIAVMGMDFKRRAKPAEIEAMKKHVEEAMTNGAFGIGVGLDGGPGDFASTDELVELAKVAQKSGGIYATHTRNCDNNYPTSNPEDWGYGICHNIAPDEMPFAKYYGLLEAIEVGRKAKIPVEIAHIVPAYTIYQYYPEYLQEAAAKATLEIIDHAREEGLDITFDIEPEFDLHGALISKPSLTGLFSSWLLKIGSEERFIENLKIEAFRDELKREIMNGKFKFIMIHPKTDRFWMDRLTILACRNREYEGKTIREIAQEKKADPFDTLFDIIIEDSDTLFNNTDPRWTKRSQSIFLKHPGATIATDLVVVPFQDTEVSGGGGLPQGEPGFATYAFYPRYINLFVKEEAVLGLEEAIKKATYLPAQRFGLQDRGLIKPNAYADILLFDFNKIKEKGNWLNPRQTPEGIHYTIVNGEIVYENVTHTGVKSGKVIRRV